MQSILSTAEFQTAVRITAHSGRHFHRVLRWQCIRAAGIKGRESYKMFTTRNHHHETDDDELPPG
jgi:hypothetical protein